MSTQIGMKTLLLVIGLSLVSQGLPTSTGGKGCPSEEVMAPCVCAEENEAGWGATLGPQLILYCQDLRGTIQLENALSVVGTERRLQTLDLNSLTANFLPTEMFDDVALESLRLNRSSLLSLFNGDSTQGLSSIEELSLEDVHFAEDFAFDSLAALSSLHSLFLSGVRIPRVDAAFRDHCAPDLRFLGLGRSETTVIVRGSLGRLRGLLYLAVTETFVTEFPRDVLPPLLPDLKVLFLSKNYLSSLPADMFAGMPSLETVALGGNRITSFEAKTFAPVWSHLKHLIADDNPLICDCKIRWLLGEKKTEEQQQKVLATCTMPKSTQLKDLKDLKPIDIDVPCFK